MRLPVLLGLTQENAAQRKLLYHYEITGKFNEF